MLLVYRMLDLDLSATQVMLFDQFSDGPYHELIEKAFSPHHPVLRHGHYRGKVLYTSCLFFCCIFLCRLYQWYRHYMEVCVIQYIVCTSFEPVHLFCVSNC